MQIKTFYLNDNITLVDASVLAQVSIINIMQISAWPPPLSIPATSRHYTTLYSRSMYASLCIYVYTQVYSPPPSFLAVLHRHTAHHPQAGRGPLTPPLTIFTRRSFIKSGRPRVHSQFYRCFDRFTDTFPFHFTFDSWIRAAARKLVFSPLSFFAVTSF